MHVFIFYCARPSLRRVFSIYDAQASHCDDFSCGALALGCMGFSTCGMWAQELWFLSSSEVNWSESHSAVSYSLRPQGLHSPWNSPGQSIGVSSLSLLQGSSQPRGWTQVRVQLNPALQADSLPAEPQGKPKSTEVGSLSLLQWIFPTQESNLGLLFFRQVLYQLNSGL